MNIETLYFDDWYTVHQAAKVLSDNSDKNVDIMYVYYLAKRGKIDTLKLGTRTILYNKQQIDNYVVEARGVKARRRRDQLQLIALRKCSVSFLRRVPRGQKERPAGWS